MTSTRARANVLSAESGHSRVFRLSVLEQSGTLSQLDVRKERSVYCIGSPYMCCREERRGKRTGDEDTSTFEAYLSLQGGNYKEEEKGTTKGACGK